MTTAKQQKNHQEAEIIILFSLISFHKRFQLLYKLILSAPLGRGEEIERQDWFRNLIYMLMTVDIIDSRLPRRLAEEKEQEVVVDPRVIFRKPKEESIVPFLRGELKFRRRVLQEDRKEGDC